MYDVALAYISLQALNITLTLSVLLVKPPARLKRDEHPNAEEAVDFAQPYPISLSPDIVIMCTEYRQWDFVSFPAVSPLAG